jgi:hypothetical protein
LGDGNDIDLIPPQARQFKRGLGGGGQVFLVGLLGHGGKNATVLLM